MVLKNDKPPVDFCYLDTLPEYRLSSLERLTLTGGLELERALAWVSRRLGTMLLDSSLYDFDIDAVLEAAQFYTSGVWTTAPHRFFRSPVSKPEFVEQPVHGLGDGDVLDLRYPSRYELQNLDFLSEYERYRENKTVYVRLWRHRKPGAPTLVGIHGWTMGDQRLNSLAFLPGVFYRLGLNVALIELPYHGRRRPSVKEGGELFPSSHMVRTNEAMGQAIHDLRVLRAYLKDHGSGPVGFAGMSLGGYIGALWAALDPLDFCIPIVPMVSMTEIAWNLLRKDPAFREFKRRGLTYELLESIYRVHSPLSHPPIADSGSALIIAGLGDRIIPSRQPKLLWEHWNYPEIHWIRGGHLAHFKRSRAFLTIVRFLTNRGIVP